MATLNYKILPNRRKASGRLGIYLSLTHRKEVRYISTEFEINDESEFDGMKVCYRKDASILNKRMAYVLHTYQEKLDALNVSRYDTCARLKEELMREQEEEVSMTLEELWEWRIKEIEHEGRKTYARMNRDSAKVVLKLIGNPFIEHLTRTDVKLLARKMVSGGYSAGGIQIKMAHLKAALNAAVAERKVRYEDHPFTGYRMPSAEPRMMDVSVEVFQAVRELKSESKRINFARDLFLLSFYLGGINLTDLLMVDLSGDTLTYSRSKTSNKKTGERMTVFSIPEEARPIIARVAPKGKLKWPGVLEFKQIQAYSYRCFTLLKEELGISGVFSYYSARKTFAQFAFMLGVKTEVIEYCIGQTMKKNRPIYNYVRVMRRQADAAMRKVIDYTKDPDAFELYDEY